MRAAFNGSSLSLQTLASARLWIGLVILIGVLMTPEQAIAQSGVVPTTSSTPTFGEMAAKLNPANWKMPAMKMPKFGDLLPGQDDRTRIVKKKDNLLTDVTDTAKRSWRKTKQTLDPGRLNPMKLFAGPSATGGATAKPKQPGFFQSLFAAPESTERVARTPSEFVGQQRVR